MNRFNNRISQWRMEQMIGGNRAVQGRNAVIQHGGILIFAGLMLGIIALFCSWGSAQEQPKRLADRIETGGWPRCHVMQASPSLPSPTGPMASETRVAVGPGNVLHTVWAEYVPLEGKTHIYYANDLWGTRGINGFSTKRNMSSPDTNSQYPRVGVAPDGTEYVIWQAEVMVQYYSRTWEENNNQYFRESTEQFEGSSESRKVPALEIFWSRYSNGQWSDPALLTQVVHSYNYQELPNFVSLDENYVDNWAPSIAVGSDGKSRIVFMEAQWGQTYSTVAGGTASVTQRLMWSEDLATPQQVTLQLMQFNQGTIVQPPWWVAQTAWTSLILDREDNWYCGFNMVEGWIPGQNTYSIFPLYSDRIDGQWSAAVSLDKDAQPGPPALPAQQGCNPHVAVDDLQTVHAVWSRFPDDGSVWYNFRMEYVNHRAGDRRRRAVRRHRRKTSEQRHGPLPQRRAQEDPDRTERIPVALEQADVQPAMRGVGHRQR
jgi:hypothetical protein